MHDELRSLRGLPKDEALRIAYLEGREDLFPTKFLRIESESPVAEPESQNVCVLSRDPGSGNALAPVISLLRKEKGIALSALADGRAEEIFRKQFPVTADESGREGLDALKNIEAPSLFLTGPSEEPGIEVSTAATYPETPMVLLDVLYGDSLRLFKKFKERGIAQPEAICVIDQEAKRIILEHYPELADRIKITGLPSLDRFASEDTAGISARTRAELGISADDKVVVFMATVDMNGEFLRAVAEQFQNVKTPFHFIFRRHPRDNTAYDAYRATVETAGLSWIDTQKFDTDAVGASADVILTTTSTEGLHAICRRIPSLHINDTRYKALYPGTFLPLPQVKLGASAGTENVSEVPVLLSGLLDVHSDLYTRVRQGMETNYPRDGKNAQRVVEVIKEVLAKKQK